MTDMTADKTLAELNTLQTFFTSAKDMLSQGQIADMQGIEARVSQLCKEVMTANPDLQQAYLPELTILIDLMNLYEQELRTRHASLDAPTPAAGESDDRA